MVWAGRTIHSGRKTTPPDGSRIALIRRLQPSAHFSVNVVAGTDGDLVGDAVLLGEAARFFHSATTFQITKGQTKIDACSGGWFYLCNHVLAIERHNRF